jgi:hypothetical protein
MTLNNLGTLDSAQNWLDEARAHYEEALEDYRALADKNPDTCLPYLAMVLDNLGIQHALALGTECEMRWNKACVRVRLTLSK